MTPRRDAGGAPGTSDPDAASRALHREARVFDGHNDVALRLADDPADGPRPGGHLDPARMREGGMDGGVFAVWVDPSLDRPLERALRGVERLVAWLEAEPALRPVREAADLEEAADEGRIAAVPGIEGGYPVGDDPGAVDRLFEAGVRCLTLTWMEHTAWADAAGPEPRHGGLTATGHRVVDRLRARGMAVDVSHAADATVADVLERDDGPVIASHGGARALADLPRNLPDDLLAGIGEGGGVAGIDFFPGHLDEAWGRRYEAARRELGPELHTPEGRTALSERTADLDPVGLDRVADHVEHALAAAGPGGVGLGSDFDGVPLLPDGMRDVRDFPELTARLVDRGLERDVLRGVLGGNFRRVLRRVLP